MSSVTAPTAWNDYYDVEFGWRQHVQNVLHHLPLLLAIRRFHPRRILEVGTGTGSLSVFLSYLGCEVLSLDIDSGVLRRALQNRRTLRGKVEFVQADAFELSLFQGRPFDLAFSQGFFEHFEDGDIWRLLREQLRVAERAVFSVPNKAYGRQDRGDERLLTREEWESIPSRGGFRIQSSTEYRPITRGMITGGAWRQPPSMYMAVVAS